MSTSITILGNGGWGTAIACVLAAKGVSCTIWGHDSEYLKQCRVTRENPRYLDGIELPMTIRYDDDLLRAVSGAQLLLVALPCRFLRQTCQLLHKTDLSTCAIISLSKGIEEETLKFPSAVLVEVAGVAAAGSLSGPSMAEEVARGLPASVVIAHPDAAKARFAQETLNNDRFRVYTSEDLVGVELGGAVKNVIAIASGIVDGMALGDSAKAAMLARGMAELRRLGRALGAQPSTFAGLSGLGDLFVTCASPFGRNRSFGERIGRGMPVEGALAAAFGQTVEGYYTAHSIHQLAQRTGVEVPICEGVYAVLYEGLDPADCLKQLMSRELKEEVV